MNEDQREDFARLLSYLDPIGAAQQRRALQDREEREREEHERNMPNRIPHDPTLTELYDQMGEYGVRQDEEREERENRQKREPQSPMCSSDKDSDDCPVIGCLALIGVVTLTVIFIRIVVQMIS